MTGCEDKFTHLVWSPWQKVLLQRSSDQKRYLPTCTCMKTSCAATENLDKTSGTSIIGQVCKSWWKIWNLLICCAIKFGQILLVVKIWVPSNTGLGIYSRTVWHVVGSKEGVTQAIKKFSGLPTHSGQTYTCVLNFSTNY